MAKKDRRRKSVSDTAQTVPKSRAKRISNADVGGSTTDQFFVWDASILDHEVSEDDTCAWTWDVTPKELSDFLHFMTECSKRKWGEIEADRTGGKDRRKKHHFQDVASLPACARARLFKHLDETYTTLFRLRYGGTQRIWGVRDRAVFRLLWLDLHHQVYPTEKN